MGNGELGGGSGYAQATERFRFYFFTTRRLHLKIKSTIKA